MESGESVRDSVIREYREETGIYIINPQLKGVFTFIIKDGDHIVSEWMMFTFVADSYTGQNVSESEEGKLQWHVSMTFRTCLWPLETAISLIL